MVEGQRVRLWYGLAGVGLLAIAAFYLIGLGASFGNSDEAVYAEFIRNMQRTGDYLTLNYLGADLLQRPAITVTIYALVSDIVPGEYGIRLAPTLFNLLTAFGLGYYVWRTTERVGAGMVAVLVATGMPSVYLYGRLVLSDPPFVMAATGALLATMAAQRNPRWLVWAGAGLGAAFATKSLAAGIPSAALLPWLIRAAWKHRGTTGHRRRLVVGAGAFLALAAPFYVVNLILHGDRFVQEHIVRNLIDRASGDLTLVGVGGPEVYVRHLWLADGVLATLLIVAGVFGGAVWAVRKRDSELGVPVTYAIVVFLGLTAVSTRLPYYLLVFYPGAAVCVGLVWARVSELEPLRSPYIRAAAPALGVGLLVTGLTRPNFEQILAPAPETVVLGAMVDREVPDDQPIYTLDWYAPAIGYYGDRRWHYLLTSERTAAALSVTDPFAYTGTVHHVPPWPDGDLYIAGYDTRIAAVPGLRITRLVGRVDRLVLIKAEREPPDQ